MSALLDLQDACSYADRSLGVQSTGSNAQVGTSRHGFPAATDANAERIYLLDAGDAIPAGVSRLGDCWVLVSDTSVSTTASEPRVDERSMVMVAHMLRADQLVTEVLDGFALTKTDLAGLMGVSRQAVHGWLRGARMEADRHARLRDLHVLLQQLVAAGVDRPGVALTCPVFAGRRSAADLLRAGEWDPEGDARALVAQMIPRSVRPLSEEDRRRSVLDRVADVAATLTRAE